MTAVVGSLTMTSPQPPVLEFPAILYGTQGGIRRKMKAEGQWWAREYLKTGAFPPPRKTRSVLPGEVLVMDGGAEFGSALHSWRIHLFRGVFVGVDDGVHQEGQGQDLQRAEKAFESFYLDTPWGALYSIVSPPAWCSAKCLAKRFASALRFWEVLQGLRYAFFAFDKTCTLEQILEFIYRRTLEAWFPGGPASLTEHMALAVERMSRASRAECEQVLLRLIPGMVAVDKDFKHPEVLSDMDTLREWLSLLPLEKFEHFSGGDVYSVSTHLSLWDRELGRH